jgi:replicative superfamily II helicase
MTSILMDIERAFTACELIDKLYARWGRSKFYWTKIAARLIYGVDDSRAELCCIKHVGVAKSEALKSAGITSLEMFVDPLNRQFVDAVLKSRAADAIANAHQLMLEKSNAGSHVTV